MTTSTVQAGPLELRSLERQDVDSGTETADLRFEAYDIAGIHAELELKSGPSPASGGPTCSAATTSTRCTNG